jgi:hypothetical protein
VSARLVLFPARLPRAGSGTSNCRSTACASNFGKSNPCLRLVRPVYSLGTSLLDPYLFSLTFISMAGGAGPHETENKRMIYSLVSRHSMAGSDSEHDSEEEDERLRRIMEFVETRDVLVYDSTSKVAGFHQNGGILTSVFIRWLSYVLDVPAPFRLALRNAECAAEPLHEDQALAPGEYNIVRAGASAIFKTSFIPQAPALLVDGLPLSTPPRADIHSIPRFLLRDRPGSESVCA